MPDEIKLANYPNNILVTGPESSGNRLAARICSAVTGLSIMDYALVDEKLVRAYIQKNGPQIVVRSMPHGSRSKRTFYHPMRVQKTLDKYKTLITLRDRTCSTLSKLENHSPTLSQAEQEQDVSQELIRSVLETPEIDSYILNYETLMWLQDSSVRLLCRWLGVEFNPDSFNLKFEDANPKYLKLK